MVRRGSSVRVRQRASRKLLQSVTTLVRLVNGCHARALAGTTSCSLVRLIGRRDSACSRGSEPGRPPSVPERWPKSQERLGVQGSRRSTMCPGRGGSSHRATSFRAPEIRRTRRLLLTVRGFTAKRITARQVNYATPRAMHRRRRFGLPSETPPWCRVPSQHEHVREDLPGEEALRRRLRPIYRPRRSGTRASGRPACTGAAC